LEILQAAHLAQGEERKHARRQRDGEAG